SALDEFTREALNLELLRLWDGSGITVVYVTHNIAEAVFLSDRVVVMTPRPGRIAEVIDVPVPRPRHPDHMFAPVFTDTVRRIRNALMTRDGRSGR
ncbi:MAG: ABC transporter ATP-binding protein, partial [Acidimicrobiia bacterium]